MFWNFILIIGALGGAGLIITLLGQKSNHQLLTNQWRLLSIDTNTPEGIELHDTGDSMLKQLIAQSYLDLNQNGSFKSQFLNNPFSEGLWEVNKNTLSMRTQNGTEKLQINYIEPHKISLTRNLGDKTITLNYGL